MQAGEALIAGGGLGGMAAALALARRGWRVRVLERAPRQAEVGAGIQISPNGARVLRALGLGPALEELGVPARAVTLRDGLRCREVARLDLIGQDYFFLHRADLLEALSVAALDAGAEVTLNAEVLEAAPGTEAGNPVLELAGGARQGAELIVGADGIRSRLRAVLNGPSAPRFTGQVAWRAVVPNRTGHPPHARVHMGGGRHLVSYPLRGGTLVNLVAAQERAEWAEEGWDHPDDPMNLRTAFADFDAEVHALLAEVTAPRLWGLFRHDVAPVWARGGLALLGDAAHPMLPYLAQGANMALEDAWVLAACLDGPASREAALQRYAEARAARCARVARAALGNARKFHLRPGPLRGAAHLGMSLVSRLAPGAMTGAFDWLYGYDAPARFP